MENFILRSRRVHFVSDEVQPSVLERRSSMCPSLRSLVDCGRKRNVQCSCKSTSNGLLVKSICDRRRASSKQWTSHTTKHVVFSTKPIPRREARLILMALGSDTGNDAETTPSSKARRNPGWSFSDNLRCGVFYFILIRLGRYLCSV